MSSIMSKATERDGIQCEGTTSSCLSEVGFTECPVVESVTVEHILLTLIICESLHERTYVSMQINDMSMDVFPNVLNYTPMSSVLI